VKARSLMVSNEQASLKYDLNFKIVNIFKHNNNPQLNINFSLYATIFSIRR
jgi:hypothetical protein